MNKKLIKGGKWGLSFLYVFYLIIIVMNVIFALRDVHNSMIESSGAFGYIITYGLNLLMAGGFFVGFTIVQLIVYYVKKKSISKSLIPLIICEIIKILGNSIYIYMIDYANIRYGGAVASDMVYFLMTV